MAGMRKLAPEDALDQAVRLRDEARGRVQRKEQELRSAREELGRREFEVSARRRESGRKHSPHQQAGRHVGEALKALQAADGPLSQIEVGRRANIGTGTLTHAMQALVSDGLIAATGEKQDRSRVYRLTAKGRRGVVTRRPPGS